MKKIIENLAVILLGVITLGVVTTPEFFQVGFNTVLYTQIAISLLICCVSIIRATRGEMSHDVLLSLGVFFFTAGGTVFIFYPDYFTTGVSLSMGMWHRLSFYALPSIALEGGIGTLLLAYLNRTQKLPVYTKINSWISVLFILYSIHFIGLSFLVVLDFASVSWHMAVAKIMMVLVIILQLGAWRSYAKNKI